MLASALKDRLGVAIRPLTAREVEKFGLDSQQGVAIGWLDTRGPLGEAGLEVGDILLQLDGQAFEGPDGFANLVRSLPPRQRITLLALDHRSGNTGYVQTVVR